METMPYSESTPYRPELAVATASLMTTPMTTPMPTPEVTSDWRAALPVLTGSTVRLRELRRSDAQSLFAMLTTQEVARFISPPPSTVEGFEGFIAWAAAQRAAGQYVCFAVTVKGFDTAIGIFQLRQLDPSFETAEWGFAIGSPFWGTGVFRDGAELVLAFAFDTLGVHRLEARAAVRNGRGNGALLKVGAVQEGVLRKSFLRHGEYFDQVLYSILDDDWRGARQFPLRANVRFGPAVTH
jgi:RimJ/RimL family protein N-acetyltransferase